MKALHDQTVSHVNDVMEGCKWFGDKLSTQSYSHDWTKRSYLKEFARDFLSGEDIKTLPWWEKHLRERHHLNDRVPEDVNLIDVVEMLVDCVMAGMARNGSVHEVTVPDDVLRQAVGNTVTMLVEQIKVEDQADE